MEIPESIKNRIAIVKEFDDYDTLRRHLCPFYEGGGCPDCRACSKKESDLDNCRESYLSRIYDNPVETWTESFEAVMVKSRKRVSVSEITGIGINCNNCYMSDKCPLFKADYECGIEWGDQRPETPEEYMQFLITSQYERVKRSAVFEKLDGGVPDMGLSSEMDRLSAYLQNLVYLRTDRLSINVEATRSSENRGGGILAQLFGGGDKSLPEPKKELPAAEDAVVIEEKTLKPIENDHSTRTSKRSQRKRQEIESS